MSFYTTIARLREASYAAPAAGENPETCRVGRHDLRTTLHLIDRLDADLQRVALASSPVAGEAQRVFLVPTGEVYCGRETHTRHEVQPRGNADNECLYAAPQASEAVRTEALHLLREARALLPTFTIAEPIGNWSEKVNRFAAGRVIDVSPQADKGGGDCAKDAGGNLVQEFIDATDALLASQERKTWTSGYKNELSAGERIRIAERWRQLRAALSSPSQPGRDGGGHA